MLQTSLSLSVAALLACLIAPGKVRAQRPQADESLIQIRIATEDPTSGFPLVESAISGDEYYVSTNDLVSDADFEDLTASNTPDGLVLHVRLTEEGASRLRQATSENVGDHLGVLINSRLVAAPTIVVPLDLPDRRLTIGLVLPESEATDVAAAIEAKWN